VFGSSGPMFGFVCVEGKMFEFFGSGGGVFPFQTNRAQQKEKFLCNLKFG